MSLRLLFLAFFTITYLPLAVPTSAGLEPAGGKVDMYCMLPIKPILHIMPSLGKGDGINLLEDKLKSLWYMLNTYNLDFLAQLPLQGILSSKMMV